MAMNMIFAAVSGLRNHQTRIGVIGDNIANLNTPGFKGGRHLFEDALVRLFAAPSTPSTGGPASVDPTTIGAGSLASSVDVAMTQGTLQQTGKETDLAIEGEGFFVVKQGGQDIYTRNGAFGLDAESRLVGSASGAVVQGQVADAAGKLLPGLTDVKIPLGVEMPPQATTSVSVSGNIDATGGGQGPPSWSEGTSFGTPARAVGGDNPVLDFSDGPKRLTIMTSDAQGRETSGTIEIPGIKYGTTGDLVSAVSGRIAANDSLRDSIRVELEQSTDTAGIVAAERLVFRSVKGGDGTTITVIEIDGGGFSKLKFVAPPPGTTLEGTPGVTATKATPLNGLANVSSALHEGDRISFKGTKPPTGIPFEGSYTFRSSNPVQTIGDLLTDIERAYGSNVVADLDSSGRVVLTDTSVLPGVTIPDATVTMELQDGGSATVSGLIGDSPPFEYSLQSLVHDSKGATHELQMRFVNRSEANQWTWIATVDGAAPPEGGTGTVIFNTDGSLKAFTSSDGFPLAFRPAGGSEPMTIRVETAQTGDSPGLTQVAAASTASVAMKDGYSAGRLETIQINQNGVIVGRFSNGISQTVAKVALAAFPNASGLVKLGNSFFGATEQSGRPDLGGAGEAVSATIHSGSLELSNVDLTREFAEFIIAQRGFQANARVITTGDDLMGEVVNLKRA